jgi:dCMP deaminase
MKWHEYFAGIAKAVAMKSPDPNSKVGCVAIGPDNEIRSTGYNGLPRKMEHLPERLRRPEKYIFLEHGERNLFYNAARMGASMNGCRLYIAVLLEVDEFRLIRSFPPCTDCARGIIQCGIREVILPNLAETSGKYRDDCKIALEMLAEVGVNVQVISI